MKIVVLNDLHPVEHAGAAGIALQLAELLSKDYETEFWCTRPQSSSNYFDPEFTINSIIYPTRKRIRQQKSRVLKIYYELFDIRIFKWFLLSTLKSKPDLVWVHQIGNGIPKTIPILCWILRIRTFQTHHDYSNFSLGKLYPTEFGLNPAELQMENLSSGKNLNRHRRLKFKKSNNIKAYAFSARAKFLLRVSNLNSKNILISPQQEFINQNFGLRKIVILPNVAEKCKCALKPIQDRVGLRVLFAGRPVGKGLDSICHLVNNTQDAILLLAGPPEMIHYIPSGIPSSKFEYLGLLSQAELFSVIHSCDYVAVLSECFDVYPSILLEALEHSSKVLCTQTVGNSYLIDSPLKGFVLNLADIKMEMSIPMVEAGFESHNIRGFQLNVPASKLELTNQIKELLHET